MASDEAPEDFDWDPYEAEIVDDIPDAFGTSTKVGVLRNAVLIGVPDSPSILNTAEGRDRFAKAYVEACRRADAWQAAHREDGKDVPLASRCGGCNGYCGTCAAAAQDRAGALDGATQGDDCGCGLGPERCAAAEDGDLGG